MIEMLTGLPEGIDGFRPVGTVTRQDYEIDVVPVLDRAAAEDRRLRGTGFSFRLVPDTGVAVAEVQRPLADRVPAPEIRTSPTVTSMPL